MDIHQFAHRLVALEQQNARLEQHGSIYWGWIKHLEARRKEAMSKIEELEKAISDTQEVASLLADHVKEITEKLESAQAEDPRIADALSHVYSLHDTLSSLMPAQRAPEAVAEPEAVEEHPAPALQDQ